MTSFPFQSEIHNVTKMPKGSCHLCGKEDCGKRTGRVICKQCGKVFCVGQLHKKFGLSVEANDCNFICPKCTGICCCVAPCHMNHTHCKTFTVRENKRKKKEMLLQTNEINCNKIRRINSVLDTFSASQNTFIPLPEESPIPRFTELFDRNQRFALNAVYYWGTEPPETCGKEPSDILQTIYDSITEDMKDQYPAFQLLNKDLIKQVKDNEIVSSRSNVLNSFIKQLMDSTITAHVVWTFTTIAPTVGDDENNNNLNSTAAAMDKMILRPPKPGPALSVLLRTYDSLIISLENKSHYDANSDSRLSFDFCIINHHEDSQNAAKILATSISLITRTISAACGSFDITENWSLGPNYKHSTTNLADLSLLDKMYHEIQEYATQIQELDEQYVIIIKLPGVSTSEDPVMKNVPLLSFIILDIIKSDPKSVLDINKIFFEKNIMLVKVAFNIKKDWTTELSTRSKFIQYEVMELKLFKKSLDDENSEYSSFDSVKSF